jgi:hypothetical protein
MSARGLVIGQPQVYGTGQFRARHPHFLFFFLSNVLLENAILALDFLGRALSRPQVGHSTASRPSQQLITLRKRGGVRSLQTLQRPKI